MLLSHLFQFVSRLSIENFFESRNIYPLLNTGTHYTKTYVTLNYRIFIKLPPMFREIFYYDKLRIRGLSRTRIYKY